MGALATRLKHSLISLKSRVLHMTKSGRSEGKIHSDIDVRANTILSQLKSLERIATIEETRYIKERKLENMKMVGEYLEVVREYRELMKGFLVFVKNPELIDDDSYKPQYLINRFLYAIEKYQTVEDPDMKEKYGELVDLLAEWSQKIMITKRLSMADIEQVLEIAVLENVDIYTYSETFPDLFEANPLPADIFSETMSFIAYAYAVLNRVKLPDVYDAAAYVKNYAQAGDKKAIEAMVNWLTMQVNQHYIPLMMLQPEDLAFLNPTKMWIIVEYADIVNYAGKATNYNTVEEFDYEHEWNTFMNVIQMLKDKANTTDDFTEIFRSRYNDKWLGNTVANIIIGVSKK